MDLYIFIKKYGTFETLDNSNFIKSFEMDKRDSSVYTTLEIQCRQLLKFRVAMALLLCFFFFTSVLKSGC